MPAFHPRIILQLLQRLRMKSCFLCILTQSQDTALQSPELFFSLQFFYFHLLLPLDNPQDKTSQFQFPLYLTTFRKFSQMKYERSFSLSLQIKIIHRNCELIEIKSLQNLLTLHQSYIFLIFFSLSLTDLKIAVLETFSFKAISSIVIPLARIVMTACCLCVRIELSSFIRNRLNSL